MRLLAVAAGLLLAVSLPCRADSAAPQTSQATLTPWTGGEKSSFALDDIERRKVALNAQAGKVVLVHFFATWCDSCRDELPALYRLVARSDTREFSVLAISVAEPDARVRAFFDKLPVNFPILLDRDRGIAKSWGVYALPTTFVLDRDLKLRLFIESDYDWDKFDVNEVLKSGAVEDRPFKAATSITFGAKP